jgi:hypothetical protein
MQIEMLAGHPETCGATFTLLPRRKYLATESQRNSFARSYLVLSALISFWPMVAFHLPDDFFWGGLELTDEHQLTAEAIVETKDRPFEAPQS